MSDPTTINKVLATPTRGSDSGTWDVPVNNNAIALDGMLGGFTNIALSAATSFALTTPSGSVSAGAGPNQSQNALIRFSGTLTGNVTVQFTLPGYYVIENLCGGTPNFYVQLAPSAGTGNAVGAVPFKKCHVFFDGTSMDYVNMPDPGTAYDLHGATNYPPWMNACTVKPYLIKDGTVYNAASFPGLFATINNQFGGNGITTFAVPDERARMRVAFDPNGTGRVTSPVNAGVMAAAGGSQSLAAVNQLPQFTPGGSVSVSVSLNGDEVVGPATGFGVIQVAQGGAQALKAPNITASGSFTGNAVGTTNPAQALPPIIVSFLALIKT